MAMLNVVGNRYPFPKLNLLFLQSKIKESMFKSSTVTLTGYGCVGASTIHNIVMISFCFNRPAETIFIISSKKSSNFDTLIFFFFF